MNLDCTCFDSKFQDVAGGGGLLAPAVLQGPLLGSEHLLYSNTQHTASHGRRLLAPPVLQGLLWQTHSK